MKSLFSLCIVGLLAALGLSWALDGDLGYVRISLGHWLFESNVWVMLALNLVLLAVALLLWGVLKRALSSQAQLKSWLGHTAAQKAISKTNEGLLSFLEGNWSEASKLLKRSAKKSHTPTINYLAAAHAANELGNSREAEQLLKQAYQHTKESDFAIGIAQAQMQLEKNQLEPCLATLVRLKSQKPQHPFVLKLLKSVYVKLEDWQQLLQLIPKLRKLPSADKIQLNQLEEFAWRHTFSQKTDELKRNHQQSNAADELAKLWQKLPEPIRFDEQIIASYAQQLIQLENEADCEALLRKVITHKPSNLLIDLYGKIKGKEVSEQLITAEKWLKEQPKNATLLRALGRISLRNELWGKANEYFEASINLEPSLESYAELCRLAPCLGKDPVRTEHYLNGLINSMSLPALPMPK